ncbi:MAG TPA: winged helix-turn-helix domain-containing protein [Steroidobacteraceae bacterium]|nr:winged helix-turn-helix domain-containing protein [Steroidobacteraceae bacterium]
MAFTSDELRTGFRIGDSLIEPRLNRIVRDGHEVRLEPRVMDVLVCLAERAEEVVSRDALNRQVWANVVVTDQAVTNCISELRHHLGDNRPAQRIIETISKRGYKLAAPVHLVRPELSPASDPSPAPPPSPRGPGPGVTLGGALLITLAAAIAGWWWWKADAAPNLTSIAVLRFENAAGDASLDYLSLALPDEIATLLTKSPGIAVRPFGYVDGKDPLARAHERGVGHIVTGRFYREKDGQLSLAVEAQHVAQERVVWRTRITAPAGDLVAMRNRISEGLRNGMLPALGVSVVPAPGSTPAHDDAYQLYLRSLAIPQQPHTGVQAIEMLERAVAIEPQFAPAWQALGTRYYAYGTWWEGGEEARKKSLAAHRRALEADPDLIDAARNIVTHRAESGDLEGAYQDARRLLDRFGPASETHFSLSYVYRYGGLLEESQRHCELAREHDPQDPRLRSCGYAYLYAGKLDRAMEFFELDAGSYFVQWATVLYQLRRHDSAAALQATRQAADDATRRFMEPCLQGVRGQALDQVASGFFDNWFKRGDPETGYALAAMLVYCDRPQQAMPLIEWGVDGNYCSYPLFDQDPIWAGIRDDPQFQRIRVKAIACHERFRRAVDAFDRSNH